MVSLEANPLSWDSNPIKSLLKIGFLLQDCHLKQFLLASVLLPYLQRLKKLGCFLCFPPSTLNLILTTPCMSAWVSPFLFFFFFFNEFNSVWHRGPDNAYFFHGHYLRNIADDVEDGKNRGGCHTLPPEFAIDLQPVLRLGTQLAMAHSWPCSLWLWLLGRRSHFCPSPHPARAWGVGYGYRWAGGRPSPRGA